MAPENYVLCETLGLRRRRGVERWYVVMTQGCLSLYVSEADFSSGFEPRSKIPFDDIHRVKATSSTDFVVELERSELLFVAMSDERLLAWIWALNRCLGDNICTMEVPLQTGVLRLRGEQMPQPCFFELMQESLDYYISENDAAAGEEPLGHIPLSAIARVEVIPGAMTIYIKGGNQLQDISINGHPQDIDMWRRRLVTQLGDRVFKTSSRLLTHGSVQVIAQRKVDDRYCALFMDRLEMYLDERGFSQAVKPIALMKLDGIKNFALCSTGFTMSLGVRKLEFSVRPPDVSRWRSAWSDAGFCHERDASSVRLGSPRVRSTVSSQGRSAPASLRGHSRSASPRGRSTPVSPRGHSRSASPRGRSTPASPWRLSTSASPRGRSTSASPQGRSTASTTTSMREGDQWRSPRSIASPRPNRATSAEPGAQDRASRTRPPSSAPSEVTLLDTAMDQTSIFARSPSQTRRPGVMCEGFLRSTVRTGTEEILYCVLSDLSLDCYANQEDADDKGVCPIVSIAITDIHAMEVNTLGFYLQAKGREAEFYCIWAEKDAMPKWDMAWSEVLCMKGPLGKKTWSKFAMSPKEWVQSVAPPRERAFEGSIHVEGANGKLEHRALIILSDRLEFFAKSRGDNGLDRSVVRLRDVRSLKVIDGGFVIATHNHKVVCKTLDDDDDLDLWVSFLQSVTSAFNERVAHADQVSGESDERDLSLRELINQDLTNKKVLKWLEDPKSDFLYYGGISITHQGVTADRFCVLDRKGLVGWTRPLDGASNVRPLFQLLLEEVSRVETAGIGLVLKSKANQVHLHTDSKQELQVWSQALLTALTRCAAATRRKSSRRAKLGGASGPMC